MKARSGLPETLESIDIDQLKSLDNNNKAAKRLRRLIYEYYLPHHRSGHVSINVFKPQIYRELSLELKGISLFLKNRNANYATFYVCASKEIGHGSFSSTYEVLGQLSYLRFMGEDKDGGTLLFFPSSPAFPKILKHTSTKNMTKEEIINEFKIIRHVKYLGAKRKEKLIFQREKGESGEEVEVAGFFSMNKANGVTLNYLKPNYLDNKKAGLEQLKKLENKLKENQSQYIKNNFTKEQAEQFKKDLTKEQAKELKKSLSEEQLKQLEQNAIQIATIQRKIYLYQKKIQNAEEINKVYGQLTIEQRLTLTVNTIKAYLEQIKKNEVYHRDIKGKNAIVDENLSVKLIDFGLSQLAKEKYDGDRPGTLPYMAPELFTAECAPDYLSDAYSLGELLYKLWGVKSNIIPKDDNRHLLSFDEEGEKYANVVINADEKLRIINDAIFSEFNQFSLEMQPQLAHIKAEIFKLLSIITVFNRKQRSSAEKILAPMEHLLKTYQILTRRKDELVKIEAAKESAIRVRKNLQTVKSLPSRTDQEADYVENKMQIIKDAVCKFETPAEVTAFVEALGVKFLIGLKTADAVVRKLDTLYIEFAQSLDASLTLLDDAECFYQNVKLTVLEHQDEILRRQAAFITHKANRLLQKHKKREDTLDGIFEFNEALKSKKPALEKAFTEFKTKFEILKQVKPEITKTLKLFKKINTSKQSLHTNNLPAELKEFKYNLLCVIESYLDDRLKGNRKTYQNAFEKKKGNRRHDIKEIIKQIENADDSDTLITAVKMELKKMKTGRFSLFSHCYGSTLRQELHAELIQIQKTMKHRTAL